MGNIEAALRVSEGIDIASATLKMKIALASRRREGRKRRSQNLTSAPISVHAVSLLLEAIFLKAKCLQGIWRFKGVLYEKKGLYREAIKAFTSTLGIDPTHVPSLISTAVVLRQLNGQSNAVIRSILMAGLKLDRTNSSSWYNLWPTQSSKLEAADCFSTS